MYVRIFGFEISQGKALIKKVPRQLSTIFVGIPAASLYDILINEECESHIFPRDN